MSKNCCAAGRPAFIAGGFLFRTRTRTLTLSCSHVQGERGSPLWRAESPSSKQAFNGSTSPADTLGVVFQRGFYHLFLARCLPLLPTSKQVCVQNFEYRKGQDGLDRVSVGNAERRHILFLVEEKGLVDMSLIQTESGSHSTKELPPLGWAGWVMASHQESAS